MSAKPLPADLPIQSFPSASDFEAFLEREHTTAQGIYLKLAKKSSGISSVSATEAVEIALCFGWIDGRANPFDESWWLVRYTPRRPKSIWSQKNVATIGRLREEGRIRPAGEAAVAAAQADGRWERAYAGPANITVPDDLAAALVMEPTAGAFLDSMRRSDRYALLMRLQTASTKTRAKRIEALVSKLADDHAKSVLKPVRSSGVKKSTAKRRKVKPVSTISIPINSSSKIKTANSQPHRTGLRHRS